MTEPIPKYVSHVSDDSLRYEAVRDHLREVAEMASEFARPFGAEQWAYAAGMAHDVGKYSEAFQRRILHDGPKVDHSTAGARALFDEFSDAGCALLAYCVAGHHGGLPDGGTDVDDSLTLIGRLKKAEADGIPDASAWREEIAIKPPNLPKIVESISVRDIADARFGLAFLVRMVFSCLVDADFLCTERFMAGRERDELRYDSIPVLRDRLEQKLAGFYPPKTPLNEARCGLLDDCLRVAAEPHGVFTITAPTGSGKTYALMRFALNHACAPENECRRIIVAEPYTSIIEQNAEVYREVFGGENVLEHHANFDFDSARGKDDKGGEDDGLGNRLRLAAENWDAPIVVTTNVQLFESLYASRTSRCRKLHNIAGSVIVLDEAQMIPTPFLMPCVKALAELVRDYGCSVVLCSATQPALNCFFAEEGLKPCEVVSDVDALFDALKRVTYRSLGRVSDDELVDKLVESGSALCIVNSRRQARALYDLLAERDLGEAALYHLTTLMYPEHRKSALAEINHRMKNLRQPCIVVATSLVEAGVDLDFPVVFRAMAGLDSIVQAAGRCNRENNAASETSIVYVFEAGNDYKVPGDVANRAGVARSVSAGLAEITDESIDLDSPSLVTSFFERLYFYEGEGGLDKKQIVEALSEYVPQRVPPSGSISSISFKSVAESFRLIDERSHSIIVPSEDVRSEIARLEAGFATRADMRRLGVHTVNVYDGDLKALCANGLVKVVADDLYLLLDESAYSEKTGLDVAAKSGKAICW